MVSVNKIEMSTTNNGLPKTETAWDWLQRELKEQVNPHDPHSAAWAFCRGATGIGFVDTALKQNEIPVVDIRGPHAASKTLTLISIAARFVVDTRNSVFIGHTTDSTSVDDAPRVYLLDSQYDVTLPHLLYAVKTTLLRKHTDNALESFEEDLEECLSRVHLVTSSDGFLGWVPILESLRHRLQPLDTPTLVLWNGFLAEPEASSNEISRALVVRLAQRLLMDCTVLWITTTNRRRYEWERHVTQKIHLEDGVASVHRTRMPFRLSLYGVLS